MKSPGQTTDLIDTRHKRNVDLRQNKGSESVEGRIVGI